MRNLTITGLGTACLLITACGGLVDDPGQKQRLQGAKGDNGQVLPTCYDDADCGQGEFCRFDEGMCLLPTFAPLQGTCAARPQACTRELAPVCGCDGKTYGNACGAAAVGVSVASQGECSDNGGGGNGASCYDDAGCAVGEYCRHDEGMCLLPTFAPLQGTCEDRPQYCYELYAPVCGCDGQSYGNDCDAAAAGVSVASQGECQGSGNGKCTGNADCAVGEYCKHDEGMCLLPTFAPLQGTCEVRPSVCTRELMPVCGCDGQSYGNACGAAAAGTSVASDGAC